MLKSVYKFCFRALPFVLQAPLARNRPDLARLARPQKNDITIDFYLGKYSVQIDTWNDSERVLLSGSCEFPLGELIRRFVKPGDHCLDIGAGMGAAAIAMADAAGEKGRIDAFEPNMALLNRLRANLDLNRELKAILHTHQNAFASNEGKVVLQPDLRITGKEILNEIQGMRRGATMEAPATTLDGFLQKSALGKVNFMKISVDNFAFEILRGGERVLKEFHPVVFVPFASDSKIAPQNSLRELLERFSYQVYQVSRASGELIPDSEAFASPQESAGMIAIHTK